MGNVSVSHWVGREPSIDKEGAEASGAPPAGSVSAQGDIGDPGEGPSQGCLCRDWVPSSLGNCEDQEAVGTEAA